jgi:hypothetical protein
MGSVLGRVVDSLRHEIMYLQPCWLTCGVQVWSTGMVVDD